MTIDEHSDLSKLTLVMPTCRRQDYAIRNMRYWSNTGVVLLVLDDSPNPIEESIIKSLGSNIYYRHETSSYTNRIVNAFPKINTKYAQLICDDEFYIISAIISSIRELEKNVSLISCSGCCLKFIVDKETSKIYSKATYEALYHDYEYTMQDDPVKRLNGLMENYVPILMYSIVRTDVWKKAFVLPILPYNFFASDEFQISLYLSFAGKSKILKELIWLRSSGEHKSIREEFEDRTEVPRSVEEWWNLNIKERNDFIQNMSEALEKTNTNSELIYNDIIVGCYEHFLKGGGVDYQKSHLQFVKKKKGYIKFYLFSFFFYIKKFVSNKIKMFFKSTKVWKNRNISFLNGADLLKKKEIKVDFDNLVEIKKIIKKFHRK